MEDLCRLVFPHNIIPSSVTEINKYMEGLKTCGKFQLMRDNSELFSKTLNCWFVDEIFDPNRYSVERKIVFNFVQYLEDVEQGRITITVAVTLQHVLQFVTGSDNISAIGFTPRPTKQFVHSADRKMYTSTCDNSCCRYGGVLNVFQWIYFLHDEFSRVWKPLK